VFCPVCQLSPASAGVLCVDCRSDLTGSLVLAPEQLSGRVTDPTRSGLVDQWGRAHLLDPKSTIGRDLGTDGGVAIHAPSISRQHAKLALDNGTWTVIDLASANGTFIDDTKVEGSAVLHTRDKVRFGQVSFFFLDHVDHVPFTLVDSETVRPGAISTTQKIALEDPPVTRWSEIQLHEPTGGGGGIIEVDGKQIQLTLAQLELVSVLIERMETDVDRDPHVRGFVSVAELLGKISLEVSLPRDAHVRQLIRRVRRSFVKAEIEDLIESRYGLGYRIRAVVRARK
jgi:pSer/pThr/pTyr-binding forkhead associated (FHA) protein